MPKAYLKCVKEGGKVRTLTGPRDRKPKLKANQYIHVCIALDGGRYWGEIKTKKRKVSSIKALVPSDIPHLLRPGGIPIFQLGWYDWYDRYKKKKKERKKKDLELEDSVNAQLYGTHRKLHLIWDDVAKYSRKDIINAHQFVVQEYKNRKMIHHNVNSLDETILS